MSGISSFLNMSSIKNNKGLRAQFIYQSINFVFFLLTLIYRSINKVNNGLSAILAILYCCSIFATFILFVLNLKNREKMIFGHLQNKRDWLKVQIFTFVNIVFLISPIVIDFLNYSNITFWIS